ncbi:hypothetical protein SNOG_06434 [Parastagonospora nodorum SN15]|uniref:Heterokaryon incompatibility domain-containing protein n=1 Tax=Phaeosphaeria nodorum (strain SN15 / ATCC MYA-4574 / FGSC 10173) TaxID=321614 RepID=Q0UP80_PHANO|nr:hypothetical protein SNOG_06434 [Parastagonospora nodorum SN15]EAT86265.1 hypothetical protein SNOG_06434 [Parastagonospora nodorum SN15]
MLPAFDSRNGHARGHNMKKLAEHKLLVRASSRYIYAPFAPDDYGMVGFRYDRLPSAKSLRILSLWPAQSGEPVQVSLETVPEAYVTNSLSGCQALSYVWGNTDRTTIITCNGKTLGITKNLYIALQAIRQPDRETTLWADAICIDQDNVEERNEQIKLMATIYSSAKRVLVWLGHSQDAEAAFSIANRMVEDFRLSRREIGLASEAIIMYGTARISWEQLYSVYSLFESQFSREMLMKFSFEPDRVTCFTIGVQQN